MSDSLKKTAEKRVVPGNGADQFNFASYMPVTLSCDHRVVDGNPVLLSSLIHYHSSSLYKSNLLLLSAGAIGAEWLKAFKGYIENPESMLL